MRVVNIMLSKIAGGIEQAFLDYCNVLIANNHSVISVTNSKAWVNKNLPKNLDKFYLNSAGNWDLWSVFKLRAFLKKIQPDVIITHTSRSFIMATKAAKGKIPIVAVAHNYNIKHYVSANAVFVITKDLAKKVSELPFNNKAIFHIPNMIAIETNAKSHVKAISVIGAMGRFVPKKGFDNYLLALEILKAKNIKFQAVLGGGGEEEDNLKELSKKLQLSSYLSFLGWVDNKEDFYNSLDVFCLPSLHEPFGIVLLEAFAYKVPVISTNSEGPVEIIEQNKNGILVDKDNPSAIADGLEKLLHDKNLRNSLAKNAYKTLQSKYEYKVVGEKINNSISEVVKQFKEQSNLS